MIDYSKMFATINAGTNAIPDRTPAGPVPNPTAGQAPPPTPTPSAPLPSTANIPGSTNTLKPNMQGNIDINFRPVVQDTGKESGGGTRAGQISTLLSTSFHDDRTGKEVLVPRVLFVDQKGKYMTAAQAKTQYDATGVKPQGQVVDNQTAWRFYLQTGENLGTFNTPEEATKASLNFHEQNDAMQNQLRAQ
jgi:hypothetical protein